jgi:hypothetical protein
MSTNREATINGMGLDVDALAARDFGANRDRSPHPDGARTILLVDGEVVRDHFTRSRRARSIGDRSDVHEHRLATPSRCDKTEPPV